MTEDETASNVGLLQRIVAGIVADFPKIKASLVVSTETKCREK